ncbi:MAG TPA: hypothetical protein VFQ76_11165 [Longimicrobiaceae bacterium]|nr:hypothetical protein [Longimicrobiaceae bacterium]
MGGPGERRLVVDRFEGDVVVARDDAGRFHDLPRRAPTGGASGGGEGPGARVELRVDREAGAAGRREAAELLARLRRNDSTGDLPA